MQTGRGEEEKPGLEPKRREGRTIDRRIESIRVKF